MHAAARQMLPERKLSQRVMIERALFRFSFCDDDVMMKNMEEKEKVVKLVNRLGSEVSLFSLALRLLQLPARPLERSLENT